MLEATYGWYWAADLLATIGANVHLATRCGPDPVFRRLSYVLGSLVVGVVLSVAS